MVRRVVVLAVALGLTLMVFLGAGYWGAVWTHYFSDETTPPKNMGEVSVKIIQDRTEGPRPCVGCLSTPPPAADRKRPNPNLHD